MLFLKVEKAKAEKARQYLKKRKIFNTLYKPRSEGGFVYFPVSPNLEMGEKAKLLSIGTLLHSNKKPKRKSHGPQRMHDVFGSSTIRYDIIGSIAVMEAKGDIRNEAAKLILKQNKRIKTILSRASAVSGTYRIRRHSYVAGKKTYISKYRENGCTFNIDLNKAFFSPRLSYERHRISGLVRKNEKVIVMFAGVGPFAIVIAKRTPSSEVTAIELNRHAYSYMLKNISENKVKNVVPVLGDVAKVAAAYAGYADRIVMPLPKDSANFLESAILCAKRNCTVHYYAFAGRDSPYAGAESLIRKECLKHGRNAKIISKRIVRPYSPSSVEIVIDFIIT